MILLKVFRFLTQSGRYVVEGCALVGIGGHCSKVYGGLRWRAPLVLGVMLLSVLVEIARWWCIWVLKSWWLTVCGNRLRRIREVELKRDYAFIVCEFHPFNLIMLFEVVIILVDVRDLFYSIYEVSCFLSLGDYLTGIQWSSWCWWCTIQSRWKRCRWEPNYCWVC